MATTRRDFIRWISVTAGATAVSACAGPETVSSRRPSAGRVVVIGGGYGGATAAKYVKMWAPDIDVIVVERNSEFISCPLSNLVLGGSIQLKDLTMSRDGLRKRGIRIVRDEAISIDPVKREVRLANGAGLGYDRLIVSPGVDFSYDSLPGLKSEEAQNRVLHAWKAGPQTVALRRQLVAMPDGGIYALH